MWRWSKSSGAVCFGAWVPYQATLRWEAGALLICTGQPKSGLRWLRTALEIEPEHQPALRLVEEYERQGGRTSSAFYRQAHTALAEYYKKFPEPRFKALAVYHTQAVRLTGQSEQSMTPP